MNISARTQFDILSEPGEVRLNDSNVSFFITTGLRHSRHLRDVSISVLVDNVNNSICVGAEVGQRKIDESTSSLTTSSFCWSWGGGVSGVAWNDSPLNSIPTNTLHHRLWCWLSLNSIRLCRDLSDEYDFIWTNLRWRCPLPMHLALIMCGCRPLQCTSEMRYDRQERYLLCAAWSTSWAWPQNRTTPWSMIDH